MQIKKITTEIKTQEHYQQRPTTFEEFIGQEHIKTMVKTAIESSKKRGGNIGHMLFSWPSGFGKTTMATLIAKHSQVQIKTVTWYAITKPAEIISILNTLEPGDILFIDEIHRLKPNIEEILYIAMEDFVIDMIMPEWGNVRIPIHPFTLIGATTKPETLSQPIKNRFVYHFYFMEYTPQEKHHMIKKYLQKHDIITTDEMISNISKKVWSVPREIANMCIKIRDFLVSKNYNNQLTHQLREDFLVYSKIDEGGMTPLHKKYLDILSQAQRPMGLKSIAIQLGINEKAVEEDIEPLLLKLGKIEKTPAGRICIES